MDRLGVFGVDDDVVEVAVGQGSPPVENGRGNRGV
jgi:hypothetical protein